MIRSRADGDHRVVVIDAPERRNALAPRDLDALAAAVTEADEAVVRLSGAGSAFCAGADLDAVDRLDDPAAFARHGQRTLRAIESAPAVVIAGVDGAARGGGVELALACDLRVGTPDATLAESGIDHGLFGAWGGTTRLPAVVGEGVARDLALSGRVLDAEAALSVGLLSRIVDDPGAVASEVAAAPDDALRRVARLFRERSERSQADQERAEATAFATLHAAREERRDD